MTKLMKSFSIGAIEWKCSWDASQFLSGCLSRLEIVLKENESDLQGRKIVFASFTGVDGDGNVVLSPESVQSHWLQVLEGWRGKEGMLEEVKQLEGEVSSALRRIKLGKPGSGEVRIDDYRNQLRRMKFNLWNQSFSELSHIDMSKISATVCSSDSELDLDAKGHVWMPCNATSRELCNFFYANSNRIYQQRMQSGVLKEEEDKLLSALKTRFLLNEIKVDRSIDAKTICDSLLRLYSLLNDRGFENYGEFLQSVEGLDVYISRYYSVDADGVLSVPYNWRN